MSTTLVFGNATDGQILSANSNYATARSGGSFTVDTAGTVIIAGQNLVAGTYNLYQGFLSWSFTTPAADQVVVAGMIVVRASGLLGTDVVRELGFWVYDWTPGGLTSADWRTSWVAQWAKINSAQGFTTGKYAFIGSDALRAHVAANTALALTAVTSRLRTAFPPAGGEYNGINSADASGTAQDPLLIISTFTRSTLGGSLACQAKLAMGGWAVIEMASGTTPRLVYVSAAGAPTTIANLPIGTSSTDYATALAAQAYALAVDSADNLYVVGRAGDQANQFQVACWTKGSGATWTTPTTWRRVGMPAFEQNINQTSAVWSPVRGGVLMVVAAHGVADASGSDRPDTGYALMDAAWVRGTTGTSNLRVADTTDVIAPPSGTTNRYNSWTNETGTMLDLARAGTRTVHSITSGRNAALSDNNETFIGQVTLSDTAGTLTGDYGGSGVWGTKDASARCRIIPISGTTVAVVAADADAGYGLCIRVYQSPAPGTWTFLGGATLDSEGLTSMPAAAAIARSQAWDAVYNSTANRIYIYYVDAANARTVRRTSFSLDSFLAGRDEIVVANNVGSVGTTVQALRADAHDPAVTTGLLTIAHNNAGVYSTQYVIDSFNLAPNAPILAPRANFDATTAATFAWTFSDPNAGDTQAAYDLQILDTAAGTLTVNTGWTVSATPSRNVTGGTLTNGKSYQWRVRTRDAGALDGPWSAYSTFSTSAGGTVTITNPASDNPAGVITDDYTITWSVAGTTQASYRIILTRTDTGATVSDTNWVTSTATSAPVSGMVSGVEHNVAVQVRNASLVASGVGNRKITPVYDAPEIPIVTLSPQPEAGYVLVSINNPVPQGDRPEVTTNLILRRAAGDTVWTQVGTALPDGTFRDYTASAWVTHEYLVRAVS